MQRLYLPQTMTYDGRQLCSHWAYNNFGLLGDAMVAFQGPCRVELSEMVDLADVREGAFIYSPLMLSFLVEHFDRNMEMAVYRQRILVALAVEQLRQKVPTEAGRIRRDGDDIFVDDRKLSVSIATVSPVSSLVHFGINVETEGTPVSAAGLAELGIDPESVAKDLMEAYNNEVESVKKATWKVRWVS